MCAVHSAVLYTYEYSLHVQNKQRAELKTNKRREERRGEEVKRREGMRTRSGVSFRYGGSPSSISSTIMPVDQISILLPYCFLREEKRRRHTIRHDTITQTAQHGTARHGTEEEEEERTNCDCDCNCNHIV